MAKCKDCKFSYQTGENTGECRRYPPEYQLVNPVVTGRESRWPAVDKDWYCGEFIEKEE